MKQSTKLLTAKEEARAQHGVVLINPKIIYYPTAKERKERAKASKANTKEWLDYLFGRVRERLGNPKLYPQSTGKKRSSGKKS